MADNELQVKITSEAGSLRAGMDQAGVVHAGDVTRTGEHAMKVPDRFLRQRKMLGQKAAAVFLREETVEAPQAVGLRADIEQIDHQQVAGLGALDADRARQIVHGRQVDVAHVIGTVVVLDITARPVEGLKDEIVAIKKTPKPTAAPAPAALAAATTKSKPIPKPEPKPEARDPRYPLASKEAPVTPAGVTPPPAPQGMMATAIPLKTTNVGTIPWRVLIPE